MNLKLKMMKNITLKLSILGIFMAGALSAQQETSMVASNDSTVIDKKISTETTEKTYKVVSNDKVIKNSVRISTSVNEDMMWEDEDAGKIDRDRVSPDKRRITKTVEIDNDEDDFYDEVITFSYMANVASDFVLISNKDEILIGLDEGENLNIMENQSIAIDGLQGSKEAYIFTDNNGKEVEFYIDEYRDINKTSKQE